MRKLASIRRIDRIDPIPDAHQIEVATLGGWKVVVKRGEYQPGDLAVYCEIDSWIPHHLAPFLSKDKEPKVFNGVSGERLRTVKLRGQVSQGLLLPLQPTCDCIVSELFESLDVSAPLGIQRWEAPIPAQLAGQARGLFPGVIAKTDQERAQNLIDEIQAATLAGREFEITEKLEGSSMTCYLIDGEFGVCSRNLDLRETADNTFWRVARSEDIEAKMRSVGDNFAVQGELIGPGVQGNHYRLGGWEFRVFDIWNIHTGQYISPGDRRSMVEAIGLRHVPVLAERATLAVGGVAEILAGAEGRSRLNDGVEREGVVFKDAAGGMTFKAISNRYLLKQG